MISSSPSHIYHSALPLLPSSSWLHKCYGAKLSTLVRVVKGLPAEWGMCSRTILLGNGYTGTLSHHNNSIVVGSECGDIIILNAITGTQTTLLSGHTELINCIVFSLNGASLVSGSGDNTVKLWDIQTGGVVKTFSGHENRVLSVSISADHTKIASGSIDYTIHLWDIQTGTCYHKIKHQSVVHHVRFSPTDPQYLISASDSKVWQWNTNGDQIKPPHDGSCVAFSSDGAHFVSCYGNTVTIYNSGSGAITTTFQTLGSIYRCSLSSDNRLVAIVINSITQIWDITSSEPQLVETFIGHTSDVTSLVFSSPTTLISASEDGSVKFWQIGAQLTGPAMAALESEPLSSAPVRAVTIQANDSIAITCDSDGMVKLWELSTGLCKTSIQTPAKHFHKGDLQLNNGRLLFVWEADEGVHALDCEKGELLWKVDSPLGGVDDLRISGDGSRIFVLCAPDISALSIQTGEVMDQLQIEYEGTSGFLVMDGTNVWAGWPKSNYQGWDFGILGSVPIKLSGLPKASSNGTLWNPERTKIKNLATGEVVFQLSGRFVNVASVRFDGSYLIAGYESGEILILDLTHVL